VALIRNSSSFQTLYLKESPRQWTMPKIISYIYSHVRSEFRNQSHYNVVKSSVRHLPSGLLNPGRPKHSTEEECQPLNSDDVVC
jgi:hypothetical protein